MRYLRVLGGLGAALGLMLLAFWLVPSVIPPAQPTVAGGLPTTTPSVCPPTWQIVASPNPGPDYTFLFSLSVVSANDVWGFGFYFDSVLARPLTLRWDGQQWIKLDSPNSPRGTGLSGGAARPGEAWGVGGESSCCNTTTQTLYWDGTSWSLLAGVGGRPASFNGAAVIGPHELWAVGHTVDPGDPVGALIARVTTSTVTLVPNPNPGGAAYPNAVAVNSPSDAWVVGYADPISGEQTLIEHWDGTAWSLVPSPNPSGVNPQLQSVAVAGPNAAWAVGTFYNSSNGHYEPMIEHWDGTQWSLVSIPIPSTGGSLQGVSALAANDVWAVGDDNGGNNLILHWDGTTWSIVPSPNGGTQNRLTSVAVVGPNDVWATGTYQDNAGHTQALTLHYTDDCPAGQGTPTATTPPTDTFTPTPIQPTATSTRTISPTPALCLSANGDQVLCTTTPTSTNTPTRTSTPPPTNTPILTQAASPTPTDCPIYFVDVPPDGGFYAYVRCLACRGIVGGYPCGGPGEPCPGSYFRPNTNVTRGQVSKIVAQSAAFTEPVPSTQQTFQDVAPGSTFHDYIERLSTRGIIGGYPCGGAFEPCVAPGNRPYFRPNNNVTRGQLTKIVAGAAGWTETPTLQTFQDVAPGSTFYLYIQRMSSRGIIGGYPCGGAGEPCVAPTNRPYFRPNNNATRGQMAKIAASAFFPNCYTPGPTPTATNTPTRTPTPLPTATPSGACPMFPANNIWNRNIAAQPTHVRSAAYISSMGTGSPLHPDFGQGLYQGGPIGIPYTTVPGNQPLVPITFDIDDESDPGPYPIPTNVPIEGGPASNGDRHVLVIERGSCTLYEMWTSYPHPDGSWDAGSGAHWQLNSNALRQAGWTSADAAGLPILPGLASYDEVATGVIRHALRFTVSQTQEAYIWPARHLTFGYTNPNIPPMGLRMRLKASVNISTYPPQARVILQALKDYGMFLADNGSSIFLSGMPDERWDNDELQTLHQIHGSDFEAIDESGLMIDPNSGQSR